MLAGDERLINLDTSLFDAGVDEDLVAEFEDEEVAVDDGAGGDLAWFAISDDGGVLFGSETHFVDSFFGANGVNDANQSVRDGDKDEKEVFVGADRNNH